jgi:hypothetical protein
MCLCTAGLSDTRLLSEKYFQVLRMVSQGAKIRRARLTRHSWCVRRTLRREITFLSVDWYEAGPRWRPRPLTCSRTGLSRRPESSAHGMATVPRGGSLSPDSIILAGRSGFRLKVRRLKGL